MKPVSSNIAKLHYSRLFSHLLASKRMFLRPPNADGGENISKK